MFCSGSVLPCFLRARVTNNISSPSRHQTHLRALHYRRDSNNFPTWTANPYSLMCTPCPTRAHVNHLLWISPAPIPSRKITSSTMTRRHPCSFPRRPRRGHGTSTSLGTPSVRQWTSILSGRPPILPRLTPMHHCSLVSMIHGGY